jgi:hypothetical protein
MISILDISKEMPVVKDGIFHVEWTSEYSWSVIPWSYFSLREASLFCSHMRLLNINTIYVFQVNKTSPGQVKIISTYSPKELLAASALFEPDAYIITTHDKTIVCWLNGAADLAAIRLIGSSNIKLLSIFFS